MDIAQYLARHATAVLVDPLCAVPQIVDDGVLHRNTALLIGLDASGWDTSPEGYRISTLVPGIAARRVRDLGGTGAKIMVYLRSDTPAANIANITTLQDVIADFAAENLLLVVERSFEGGEDVMLAFETLTLVPIDRDLIDPALLTTSELAWLNDYHARVAGTLAPHLEGEDRAWLIQRCAPIA